MVATKRVQIAGTLHQIDVGDDGYADSDMKNLIQQLIACEALLKSVEETFWLGKIQSALKREVDSQGIRMQEEILSWYGGMGSFNDLLISSLNGHIVSEENEEKLNDELDRLKSQICQGAIRLNRG